MSKLTFESLNKHEKRNPMTNPVGRGRDADEVSEGSQVSRRTFLSSIVPFRKTTHGGGRMVERKITQRDVSRAIKSCFTRVPSHDNRVCCFYDNLVVVIAKEKLLFLDEIATHQPSLDEPHHKNIAVPNTSEAPEGLVLVTAYWDRLIDLDPYQYRVWAKLMLIICSCDINLPSNDMGSGETEKQIEDVRDLLHSEAKRAFGSQSLRALVNWTAKTDCEYQPFNRTQTLCVQAIQRDQPVILSLLLQYGNMKGVDRRGFTPCYEAVQGHLACFDVLVEKGAVGADFGFYTIEEARLYTQCFSLALDMNEENCLGSMAALQGIFADESITQDMRVRVLSSHRNKMRPNFLFALSCRGLKDAVNLLLSFGADPLCHDGTAKKQHGAAYGVLTGDQAFLKERQMMLSDAAADNVQKTLLVIIDYLRAANVDIATLYDRGYGLLHVAMFYGHPQVVQLLLDLGCDINQTNKCHETPLLAAVNHSKYADSGRVALAIEALFTSPQGEAINREALLKGANALHLAVKERRGVPIIAALLRNGISTSAVDKDGLTPLQLAQLRKDDQIINLLS